MRVDKYLWCVRYFKTRSVATQACKKGSVRINDAQAKPARDVFPGDIITVRKNQINLQLEVLNIPPGRVGAKLINLYRNDITPKEAFDKIEILNYAKKYYRKKGTGRPSKKDRRDLEGFAQSSFEEE